MQTEVNIVKEKYLTVRWNNIISIALGLTVALLFIFVLTGVVGDFASADAASFTALIAIGGAT